MDKGYGTPKKPLPILASTTAQTFWFDKINRNSVHRSFVLYNY